MAFWGGSTRNSRRRSWSGPAWPSNRADVDPPDVLVRAVRITHGMGLPMADALIAAFLEHGDCDRVHTSDSDFEDYEGPMGVMFL